MRRRWVIVVAALALLVAGAAFVYLRLPRAPFAFLEGHKPLSVQPYILTPLTRKGETRLFTYEFQAEWGQVYQDAERELNARGFLSGVYDGSAIASWYLPQGPTVFLYRDQRRNSGTGALIDSPGWVAVDLYGVEIPAL